jgi:leucyl aminopeptidase (aminopeptidase T)
MVMTDTAMDPLVWQAVMAVLHERGAETMLTMFPPLPYHCADPISMAIAAAKSADLVVALTTTCMNSGTPGLREIRDEGKTSILLMEESTVEILTEGGGKTTIEDMEEIGDICRRIGEVYDKGKKVHILSDSGSDFTADISGYPANYHADRWSKPPVRINEKTGRLTGGTWPWGEIHIEPIPGSATGTIVWDTTAHVPPGRWKDPVRLVIKDGWVKGIEGGNEASYIKDYLKKYGDENSWAVGGEAAIGTNKNCPANTWIMRSEKKRLGAMHFGIGHGADRHQVNSKLRLEGIVDRVTVVVDDNKIVCEKGQIKV